jgi:proline iminopeptidase
MVGVRWSWSCTLGLTYAEAYNDRASELVLFSVVTTTSGVVDWVTRQIGRVFPSRGRGSALACALRPRRQAGRGVQPLLVDPDPPVRERQDPPRPRAGR